MGEKRRTNEPVVRMAKKRHQAYQNQVCTFHRDIGAAANRDSDIGLAESCNDLEISDVDLLSMQRISPGASLTPSPVTATICSLFWSSFTIRNFISGVILAKTISSYPVSACSHCDSS
jgi:hypothetical protein